MKQKTPIARSPKTSEVVNALAGSVFLAYYDPLSGG